jgi:hypothetical protein
MKRNHLPLIFVTAALVGLSHLPPWPSPASERGREGTILTF